MKNFALIGAAGYVAPRHMKAIKDTNNHLVVALDKFDSVGILDSHFPKADFFVEFERFDRHIEKLKRNHISLDYVSICSPNYLHDAHIRMALRRGADAICEKPLVLNPWNVDALSDIEKESGKKINTILQLRLHPSILKLKEKIIIEAKKEKYDVDLTYITTRGNWYFSSWKGDESKSGGITTNIGVHFYDMLSWVFGNVQENIVHLKKPSKAAGFLEFEKARVRWFLSIEEQDLPKYIKEKNQRTFRNITINKEKVEFTDGFADLHTESYKEILSGKGFGLTDAKPSIEIINSIRNAPITVVNNLKHPLLLYR
ncbi:MAG: oxidoreductase [Flavobacteriaceae bacterium]|nr:MAG: oxidoreductase [Flavobacteriaceae bacterium]